MILTTTPTVEGRTIVEYRGVVFGEVIDVDPDDGVGADLIGTALQLA